MCRIEHQENANDILGAISAVCNSYVLVKTTSSLTPTNLCCEVGNYTGQNSILGHPIGATGIAQCAEIIYQVHITFNTVVF